MIMYFSKPTQGDRSSKTTCHRQRVHEQGGGVCTSQGGRVWTDGVWAGRCLTKNKEVVRSRYRQAEENH